MTAYSSTTLYAIATDGKLPEASELVCMHHAHHRETFIECNPKKYKEFPHCATITKKQYLKLGGKVRKAGDGFK